MTRAALVSSRRSNRRAHRKDKYDITTCKSVYVDEDSAAFSLTFWYIKYLYN